MTQRDLAAASGQAQPNISAIESGRRMPTAETLRRLLEACGFNLVARAGTHTIAVLPPDDDLDAPAAVPPVITRDTPMAHRVHALTAVLDASEAIVRARR